MKKLDHFLIKLLLFLIIWLVISLGIITLDKIFVLFSPPEVKEIFSEEESKIIPLNSSILIKFDKPLKRQEIHPSIFPEVHGEWKFKDPLIKNHFFKTLTFTPATNFKPDTLYLVKIENIKGFGLDKSSYYQFIFRTQSQPETPFPPEISSKKTEKNNKEILEELKTIEPEPEVTILKIPLDWQDYPLSCEAASLKMALTGKRVFVSEDEIMKKIGIDLTPRKGNVWGDPYQIYVGDIKGRVCETGYGVYWPAVAKAANYWREAEAFSSWDLRNLIKEIEKGNPVIVWGVLSTGTLTDCSWYTKEGKYIKAFKEMHARVVIGFIGPPVNPSKIILNDPLAGRLYWKTSYFLKNWAVFDNSGVVIR